MNGFAVEWQCLGCDKSDELDECCECDECYKSNICLSVNVFNFVNMMNLMNNEWDKCTAKVMQVLKVINLPNEFFGC